MTLTAKPIVCLTALGLFACTTATEIDDSASIASPELVPLWVTADLSEPESVLPLGDGTYLVSLVGGEGRVKDGNGAIAKLGADGSMINAAWATGLDAPKGLGMADGKVFVSDIDRVVTIDADTDTLLESVAVPGAGFLNDVLAWNGQVLVSDSANARIYSLRGSEVEVWMEDAELDGVNGLFDGGSHLIVSNMGTGTLLSVDTDTKAFDVIGDGMENADGIIALDDGTYIVSSWPGTLYHVRGDGSTPSVLLDTTAEPATLLNDIARDGDRLLIPNWSPGSVSAYQIVSG